MYDDRVPLYGAVEADRDSKLLVYVTGDRKGLETHISNDVIHFMVDHYNVTFLERIQFMRHHYAVVAVLVCVTGVRAVDIAAVLYDYSISGVPDFDQKRCFNLDPLRQGLPENDPSTCAGDPSKACVEDFDCGADFPCKGIGGAMFCVPTSAINWMAYIANHGYPDVSPGPGNWQGRKCTMKSPTPSGS